MRTKLRITLYSNTENPQVISDRLVEQKLELTSGPKATHSGPLSLEINLATVEDIDSVVLYLQKLKGSLPLETAIAKKKAVKVDQFQDDNTLEDLLEKLKSFETQEELISYLRECNFRALSPNHISDITMDMPEKPIVIKEKHSNLVFFARLAKEAKDPRNDKWDFRLAVGIDLNAKESNKVIYYLWGKSHSKADIKGGKEGLRTYKPKEFTMTFPEFMDYEMRTKFRQEHRKWATATNYGQNPENYELSKFYRKWSPYVKIHKV